ncbi:hypothetical protein LVB87_10495 [Lysobacter sp. KIS68-7]|uniref:hypothetical protein n=1 Tax=Lysobacter sp. KIS68-7 TaxID=2904252 RepID=UPI001E57BB11|nr:hypothetical protein [Lysobacter sp. KIS68-7]UHQ18626.1 hypothetical protein LVB87_10495 [Lysobacter sp. KIS68-7]
MRLTPLIASALLVGLLGGCHWWSKESKLYSETPRPLEVPPDLDKPALDAAMKLPATASANAAQPSAAAAAGAAAPIGFTVAGDRDAVFTKVGDELAKVEGLTVASRAQLLGAYDVNYGGADFLVRVTKVESGTYVSAVDPRGMPATGEAPAKLVDTLKTALGGR